MAARLNSFVHVDGKWYGPDDKVPAAVAAKIRDEAWEDGKRPATRASSGSSSTDSDGGSGDPAPPPLSGTGSGEKAWAEYAQAVEVDVPEGAKRDDIVQAIRDAGKPVEKPAD